MGLVSTLAVTLRETKSQKNNQKPLDTPRGSFGNGYLDWLWSKKLLLIKTGSPMPIKKTRVKQSWWSHLWNSRFRQRSLASNRKNFRRLLQLQTLEPRQMLAADTPGETLATAYEPTLTPGVQWTYNETIGNGLHGNKDVDFYKVTLAAGQSLTVDIDTSYYSSLNSYVRLFNSAGTQLTSNDDEEGGGYGYGYGGSLDSLLNYTASTAGVYFVGVSVHRIPRTMSIPLGVVLQEQPAPIPLRCSHPNHRPPIFLATRW